MSWWTSYPTTQLCNWHCFCFGASVSVIWGASCVPECVAWRYGGSLQALSKDLAHRICLYEASGTGTAQLNHHVHSVKLKPEIIYHRGIAVDIFLHCPASTTGALLYRIKCKGISMAIIVNITIRFMLKVSHLCNKAAYCSFPGDHEVYRNMENFWSTAIITEERFINSPQI